MCWFVFERLTVGKLFTVSRNWLNLRGAVPPWSASPQRSKHQNTDNKNVADTRWLRTVWGSAVLLVCLLVFHVGDAYVLLEKRRVPVSGDRGVAS